MSLANRVEERRDGGHVRRQANQRESGEMPPRLAPPLSRSIKVRKIFVYRENTCCSVRIKA
jgi:hypothetical protein